MKRMCCFVCVFALFIYGNAFAAFNVHMTPPLTHADLKPNKKMRQVIELSNLGYTPVKFKVYVSGLIIKQDGSISYQSGPYTAEKWISFSPNKLVVKPFDFGIIRYEIKVPGEPAPAPGSYMASMMMQQDLETDQKEKKEGKVGAGITFAARLAHTISINVGKPQYSAKLESFGVKKEKGQTKFVIHVRNPGNFNYPAQGRIAINSGDKTVKRVAIHRTLVYRNSSRTIELPVPEDLSPGSYEAVLSLGTNMKGGDFEAKTTLTMPSK